MNQKLKFLFLTFLGGFAAFSFAPCFLWPLMTVGVFYLVKVLNQSERKGQSFLYGFCFGFGLGAVNMHWLTHALMVDGGRFMMLCPLVWIGFGVWFGLFWGLSAYVASFFFKGYRRILAFVGCFIVLEWVRSWLFSGFPWNPVGNIWTSYLTVMQSVSMFGIYGLSGLTLLLFGSISLGKKSHLLWGTVATFLCFVGFGTWRLYSSENTFVWGTRLRLVQPNIEQTLKWNPDKAQDNLNKLIHLSRENNEGITHVLWPETAVSFLVNYNTDDRLQLMSALGQGGVLVTGGMRAVDPKERSLANSIFVLDDLTDIQAFYDKSHLVPFGEYMPFRDLLHLDKFVPISSDIQEGEGPKTVPIIKTLSAGMLVCYEVIFSGKVVDKLHRPAWLLNATNDGWYGMSFGPYQHLAMTQTRAIEEGLPLVRVANTGVSAVIDSYGHILKSLDLGKEGIIDSDLPHAIAPTLYAQFGIKIPLMIACFLILWAFKKK